MTTAELGVTGATGALGGEVARLLSERGIAQRMVVRDPERAPKLPGASLARCSYGDFDQALAALTGIRVLLMVSASETADRLEQHRTFINAAAQAGVQQVVYTSFVGAAPDATFTLARDHYATEQYLRGSGMAFTFLRDNFYLDVLTAYVGDDGVIRGPAGDGKVAAVAREDVARCATAILINPQPHVGATYDLSGPQALTLTQVAATITQVTRRQVSFHNETIPEAYASRRKWDAPQWQYDAWVSTYTAIGSGVLAEVTGSVRALSGQDPISLQQLLTR